jgi:hypothetical protein
MLPESVSTGSELTHCKKKPLVSVTTRRVPKPWKLLEHLRDDVIKRNAIRGFTEHSKLKPILPLNRKLLWKTKFVPCLNTFLINRLGSRDARNMAL